MRDQLPAPIVNGGENSFWKCLDFHFKGLATLTLDRVILHTVVHHWSTSNYTPNFTEVEETFCGRTDICTYIRTNRWMDRHL